MVKDIIISESQLGDVVVFVSAIHVERLVDRQLSRAVSAVGPASVMSSGIVPVSYDSSRSGSRERQKSKSLRRLCSSGRAALTGCGDASSREDDGVTMVERL